MSCLSRRFSDSRRFKAERRQSGFTLVELITILAVVSVLLGLLLPAVQGARSAARRTHCTSNMRQLGNAVHFYLEQNDCFPPSYTDYVYYTHGKDSHVVTHHIKHNIFAFLLPYFEEQGIAEKYDFSKNWQNADNKEARQTRIPFLLCPDAPGNHYCRSAPSASDYIEFFVSDFAACEAIRISQAKLQGIGVAARPRPKKYIFGLLQPQRFDAGFLSDSELADMRHVAWAKGEPIIRISSVGDGLSQTFLLFECGGRPKKFEYGKKPGDPNVTPKEPMSGAEWADPDSEMWIDGSCGYLDRQLFNCSNKNELFSFHIRGSNFLYADGSVRFLTESIAPEVFVSFFTPNDGDYVVIP